MSNSNGVPVVPEIDVVSAWKRSTSGDAAILDVREPEELDEIAVPGALHIPLKSLPVRADELPLDRELLVICRSGVRSAYATQYLLESGFERVESVAGGVIAWAEAKLPYVVEGTEYNTK